jgi:rhamnose utilization protein RhaD (predicted bifunctional aldolase and dehydrogenase)
MSNTLQKELVMLARELGDPALDLAILGEGNVSALAGDGTFWVKASGSSLATLAEPDLSCVRLDAVLELLEQESMDEAEVEAVLSSALADPAHKKPSVETFLHALCLSLGGAAWVGHTHALAVNQILCSTLGAEPFKRHIFPDAVVVCGHAPAVVPYADPGFALAKAVQRELERYQDAHGTPPKLLLMESHGPVALGGSAREVLNITLMADKWAQTLQGTYALGGPRFLPESEVARIDSRPDEDYRRRRLVET